ncbi:MAG: hypothetical protein U0Y08_01645 [Bacteroidia bacterium]
MREDKTRRRSEQELNLLEKERTNPYRTTLFFGLVGSSLLFLSLAIMLIIWVSHNPPVENFRFPREFTLSTLILLGSSYLLTLVRKYYSEDNDRGMLMSLTGSMVMAGLFAIFQLLAWNAMIEQGFDLEKDISITFIFGISAVHFLHAGGGMIYMFYLWLKSFDIWNDPVRSLLYFSNKYEGVRLELFSNYWHVVNGLWLFVFLTFLFTF